LTRAARAPRVLTVRAALLIATSLTLVMIGLIVAALTVVVVPSATTLRARASRTLTDFSAQTNLASRLEQMIADLRLMIEHPEEGVLSADELGLRRLRVESLLRSKTMLQPDLDPATFSPALGRAIEEADGSATHLGSAILGLVGALEVEDAPAARRLLARADSLEDEHRDRIVELTSDALADLERAESRLERDAGLIGLLFGVWLLTVIVAVPVLWWLLQRRLFTPIAALDDSLTRIQAGDLNVELPVTRFDELGRLSNHFNNTTAVLRAQRAALGRAAAAAAVAESEQRYRDAFEHAAVGLAEIALDGTYVRINRAMSAILGREPSEIVGHRFTEFTHPEDASIDMLAWPRLLQGEPIVRIEKRYRRGDGSLASVQVTGALLTDGDGAPRQVITVVQDVTEQRRLEHELLQSMKMDAVGQLAGGVAHDFNNLLAGIIGYAELLEHDAGSSEEVREDAIAIRRTATRGADLARSLLTLARRNPHREEPFALDAMLRETVELIRRTFDRRIEVHASVDLPATIRGDRSLLSNALLNLALNARDAMPTGGTLHITAEESNPSTTFRVRHGVPGDGPMVCIAVRDSGAGMRPEVLSRVFEPFFTTKEAGKGTGLGLAMVYGTIKDHRGTIMLDSTPGEGTTARVYLPCTMDGIAPSLSERSIIPAAPGVRVLVVDDEDLVRDVAVRMLHRLGYEVEAVEDGMRAIERLDRDDHGFTVVLLDGNMPRLNGLETARRVHARHPALALVYASGFFDPADQEDLPSLGFRERLVKPYTMEALSRAIALASGQRLTPP